MRAFQTEHGLPTDGVCDDLTWATLVEAGYRLGDRTLYQRRPMLRGDDVAALQRRLGALGFNAGKVDGIFGPLTASALLEFQRNAGLTPDGICGYSTVQTLERLGNRISSDVGIASVLEAEALRHAPRTLTGRRVAVGSLGGLGALVRALGRELRLSGAVVLALDEPDGSLQAQAANRFGADLYLGIMATDTAPALAFYAVPGFESTGGRRLAELLSAEAGEVDPHLAAPPVGQRRAVLRETRMPAVCWQVHVTIGSVTSPRLVAAAAQAITTWATTAPDEPST